MEACGGLNFAMMMTFSGNILETKNMARGRADVHVLTCAVSRWI